MEKMTYAELVEKFRAHEASHPDTHLISPEDIVVVQTGHHGLAVARVVALGEPGGPVSHGREIVCKVDLSAFEERKARAAQLVELKARMDQKVQQLQKAAVYEMLAERDPELAAMLQAYKDLLAD